MKPLNLSRRTRVILLVGAAFAVVIVAVGVYGLLRGPAAPGDPDATSEPSMPRPTSAATVAPSPVPIVFARNVAEALFMWDTASGAGTDQIIDTVLAVGDGGGDETPGLRADIALYLPTAAQWAQLREYRTAQHIEIEEAFIPETWRELTADHDSGLPAAAVAVTIDGTRVRTGEWLGEPANRRWPVTFTVFLLCPERDAAGCHVLRLSEPGKSLR